MQIKRTKRNDYLRTKRTLCSRRREVVERVSVGSDSITSLVESVMLTSYLYDAPLCLKREIAPVNPALLNVRDQHDLTIAAYV